MMSVALDEKNVYENFDQETDVLFFKLGSQGLVSFHGRNYNRKKSMSVEELRRLTNEKNYFQISSDCFINLSKIRSISDGTVYFGSQNTDCKQLHVNRRKQYAIEQVYRQFAQ
ncbi:hypothetical protein ACX1C1_13865 [Paenibacillus sp. strain BS8-2]